MKTDVVCPSCGIHFSATVPDDNELTTIPSNNIVTFDYQCPNCNEEVEIQIPLDELQSVLAPKQEPPKDVKKGEDNGDSGKNSDK